MKKWNKRGFTLIELLVVVLIIGILAAVAVPQYQRAVIRARSVDLIKYLSNTKKALELYVLANGIPDEDPTESFDVVSSLSSELSKYLTTSIYCSKLEDMCQIEIQPTLEGVRSPYGLNIEWRYDLGVGWEDINCFNTTDDSVIFSEIINQEFGQ